MKIAVFHDLPSGGAKRSLHEVLRRLSLRHEIDVYTYDTADQAYCDLRPWSRHTRVYHFQPRALFRSPFGRLNQLQRWRDLRRLDDLARRVAAEIDCGGYDVVLAQPCMWTQAPLVLRHLHTPSVYYCHEPPRALYEPRPESSLAAAPWRAFMDALDPALRYYRSAARRYDREATRAAWLTLVNSEFTRRNAVSIYGVEARVSYHGVDADRFSPLPGVERSGDVLSVGTLQPTKGFEFLIQSLGCLPEPMRPTLRLIANAEAPGYRETLHRSARRWGVRLAIEVNVDDSTLAQRYNAATALVYAPYREPFGLVPLEAMACGTPVVAVAEGGVVESVVHGVTGLLSHRHPQEFADALAMVLADPLVARRLGRQARERVMSEWTWEAAAERVERHLEAAVESTRIPAYV